MRDRLKHLIKRPRAVRSRGGNTMTRKKTGKNAGKGPSQRMLRIGELIRHKIAELLTRGEIHDDVIAGHSITIPEVRISPDMKLATVYVMPLGGSDMKPVIEALMHHRKYIRAQVAQTLNLRYAPDLRFREDETFEEATRIDRLLDSPKVRQDIGPRVRRETKPKVRREIQPEARQDIAPKARQDIAPKVSPEIEDK